MKTRDGVDFHLGMPLVTDSGKEFATSEATHEIDAWANGDTTVYNIGYKGGGTSAPISAYYATQAGRLRDLIGEAEAEIEEQEGKILRLLVKLSELEAREKGVKP